MKKLTTLLLTTILLASCSSSNEETISNADGCSVLNVFNTGEYIGENTNRDFEKKYGVKINYSLFASNEEMYTKLLVTGSNYDVLVPSDYTITKLINEGKLAKIDKSKLENYNQISEELLGLQYDPNNDYSIPYFYGTVGIAYDSTKVSQSDVESQGWEVLRNPKYKSMIYLYDAEREGFLMALKALGYSQNDSDLNHLQEAYNWLKQISDTMDPAFVTDEIIDNLMYNVESTGRAMGVVYSGDAVAIMSENENIKYFEPNEGTNFWNDAFVIPANSKCPDLAHKYIDFNLSYDVALDNSLTVGYTSYNKQVKEELSSEGGEFFGINAYTPRSGYSKDEPFINNDDTRKIISEYWTKIKLS